MELFRASLYSKDITPAPHLLLLERMDKARFRLNRLFFPRLMIRSHGINRRLVALVLELLDFLNLRMPMSPYQMFQQLKYPSRNHLGCQFEHLLHHLSLRFRKMTIHLYTGDHLGGKHLPDGKHPPHHSSLRFLTMTILLYTGDRLGGKHLPHHSSLRFLRMTILLHTGDHLGGKHLPHHSSIRFRKMTILLYTGDHLGGKSR